MSILRRTLRQIPEFRSLPADKLDALAKRITFRKYYPGEVIWHTGAPNGFVGIIQGGELLVEWRMRGVAIHSRRLVAGEILSPKKLLANNPHSSILVRAVRGTQIQVLPSEGLKIPPRANSLRARSMAGWLWVPLVAVVLLFLSWKDLTRIASGALYLLAGRDPPSAANEARRMMLLDYAGAVDASAAFVPNQEGYLLFQHNDLIGAETAFTEAVLRSPNGSPALNNLAVVCFQSGRYDLAVELEQKAVRNAPDDAILRYNLGLALVAAGRGAEAFPEFMQATYIDPVWALPHVQRAYLYLQQQDYLRAEDAAGEAIRLDASQETAHLMRAIALYNQGKYPEALEAIRNALGLDPEDRVAMFYEAMTLSGLGQYDPALATLNRLLIATQDPAETARITTEIEAVQQFQQESLAGMH